MLREILILGMVQLTLSTCPCSVEQSTTDVVLSCEYHSINHFPEDLSECTFDRKEIESIQLFQQPLEHLGPRAFADFVNLKELGIAYCRSLGSLSTNVFEGIPELNGLFIVETNLTQIPQTALDNLTRLRSLDVRQNEELKVPYVTKAWHFCRRVEAANYDLKIEGDIELYKFLSHSSTTDDYCIWRQDHQNYSPSVEDKCSKDNDNIYTCPAEDIDALACQLQENDFTDIIFEFPSSVKEVQNFYEAETNSFFEQFNYQPDDLDYAKVMTTQQLYGTKLDLSDILLYTSLKTEKIIIHADTVYMSKPVEQPIHFDIIIRSRVTSIDYPIPMKFTKERFFEGFTSDDTDAELETWAMKEEHVRMTNDMTIRIRKLGRIEILDELPANYFEDPDSKCVPYEVNVTDYTGDTSSWYDVTSINLNYIGARTLLTTRSNNLLLGDMTNFQLNYINDAKIVGEPRAFIAGQKFFTIQQLMAYPDTHNVPIYGLSIIKDLAQTMHDRLGDYRATEIQTEMEMSSAKARVRDMQVNFDIVQAQQELYFETEKQILDSIFSAINESWHWSFEHRNAIQEKTDASFQLIMDNIFDMQREEYQHMLSQAEDAKAHYQATVDKYQTQVDRYLYAADELMKYMGTVMDEMDVDVAEMDKQMKIFEQNVEKWKEAQEAKAAKGLFKAIFAIGKAIVEAIIDPALVADAIKTAAQGLKDIKAIMKKLEALEATINQIMKALEELEGEDLEDMSIDMSIDYKDALANAIQMKEMAPTFDDIQNTAQITLSELNEATNHEIAGTSDVMVACTKVSQCGRRMTDTVSDFADKMMQLAERQDELIVAKEDLSRSTQQVEEINKMLEDLSAKQEEYQKDTDAARKEYEDKVAELEAAWDTASTEMKKEYQEQIASLYGNFQNTFNVLKKEYNDELGELMSSIQAKNFGLRDASMTQRSMVMTLFYDACDTMFYSYFHVCSQTEMPMMSDDFSNILAALSQIEWDDLTSTSNLPVPPTNFILLSLVLKDDAERSDFPVQELKDTGRLSVNLKNYDFKNRFDAFWRTRVNLIRFVLLQADGTPIPSPGVHLGDEIQIHVVYPTIFNNTNANRENFKFMAQELHCNSDYITNRATGEPTFKRSCSIDEDFLDRNYKSSVDGIYSLWLENKDVIDIGKLDSILIEFSGSNIPFSFGDKLTHLD